MKYGKIIFVMSLLIVVSIISYLYIAPFFSSTERNLETVDSEIIIESNNLINSFITDEENADKLYSNKVIEVVGTIKEVSFLNNRKTIVLKSNIDDYGIICDIHSTQIEKIKKLKKHQKIKVKGICKGFLKDVILHNCFINIKLDE